MAPRSWSRATARSTRTIRHLYHPHAGISATRNLGIGAATGDFIAIVADDYLLPANYVLTILDFFRERPEAQVVRFKIVGSGRDLGSRISHFYYDVSMRRRIHDELAGNAADFTTLKSLFRKMPMRPEEITTRHELEASGAAAFRREVFDQVGLFDENLARGEDTDLTVRLRAQHIEVYYNPHVAVEHRYEPLMLDTLRKCFESGWSRYLYNRKHAPNPNGKDWKINTPAMARFGTLLNALRHLETPGQFALYAPFMVLFEGVNKLGYGCAWMAAYW